MQKIIKEWQAKRFKNFYWFEGEEPYFLDSLANYAEQNIIAEEAKIFDEDIFYGSDLNLDALQLQCLRPPVYGERRLILIKEAQSFKDAEKFCQSFTPTSEKVLVIAVCKAKRMESKAKVKKRIQELGVYYFAKKIYENQLPEWIMQYLAERELRISPEALQLLLEAVGLELNRLANELQKLALNLQKGMEINADMVSRYVGLSREYSLFELQNAFNRRDVKTLFRIMHYISENPKQSPFILVVSTLHAYFLKLLLCKGAETNSSTEMAKTMGIHPFFLSEYMQASRLYPIHSIEESIQLLTEYHLRYLGISSSKQSGDAALSKECLSKIMLTLRIS